MREKLYGFHTMFSATMSIQRLREEIHDTLRDSALAKFIVILLLLAGVAMLYFPIQTLIADPSNLTMIVYIVVVGVIALLFLGLILLGCTGKPRKQPPTEVPTRMPTLPQSATRPSAVAPSLPPLQEDAEGNFIAVNPLAKQQTPVS